MIFFPTNSKNNMIDCIKQYFSQPQVVTEYKNASSEIGLWESEKAVFTKYIHPSDHIIDIGCGTGRIAENLYKLGYHSIEGFDFCKEMLSKTSKIKYFHHDATLPFAINKYNVAIFGFNGLMLIQGRGARYKVVRNTHRALQPNGHFIFTTFDARYRQDYVNWENYKALWMNGKPEKEIIDYGDQFYDSENGRTYFHFPTDEEIIEMLVKCGFRVLDYFLISERYNESKTVLNWIDDAKFWVSVKM